MPVFHLFLIEKRIKQGETEYYKITMESLNMEAASKVSEEEMEKVITSSCNSKLCYKKS
jgi:CRISPR/Cas system-associated protein Csm6